MVQGEREMSGPIVGVYGINNFISMNKQSDVAWDAIIPKAEDALRRVFP